MDQERFRADPVEIAGLGRLVAEVGTQTMSSVWYLREHAVPHADFTVGALNTIREPFEALEKYWRERQSKLASKCLVIGENLNTAAWLYDDQDLKNYDAINAAIDVPPGSPAEAFGDSTRQSIGTVPMYDDVVDYGAPEGIEYTRPQTIADDFADVIRDAAGWVGDLDAYIESITQKSPIRELLNPIGGNWNEVNRLGSTYRIAGEAMEHAAESLRAGTQRVDDTWDGKAAVAFNEYARARAAAMEWEGPTGRVIEAISNRIAEEMKKSVIGVVVKIKELLDKEVDLTDGTTAVRFALKKIPFVGTAYQIVVIVDIVKQAIDIVDKMVAEIKAVTDMFAQFISAVTSPTGYLNDKSNEILVPVTELLDKVDMGLDIAETSDLSKMLDAPKQDFSVGTGTSPWEDAV